MLSNLAAGWFAAGCVLSSLFVLPYVVATGRHFSRTHPHPLRVAPTGVYLPGNLAPDLRMPKRSGFVPRTPFLLLGLLLLLAGLLSAAAVGYRAYRLRAFYATRTRATGRAGALHSRPATEVGVLGTVHFPTVAFTADSLYNALETVRPDVILFEIDSARIEEIFQPPPLGQRVALALGLKAESNELLAVTKYRRFHPSTLVRPYEWGQRDAFHRRHHILTTPDTVFTKLAALRAAGQLTRRQQRTLATYDSLTARLNATSRTQPLAVLNSTTSDSLAQRRQYCQYHSLRTIIEENDGLQEFRSFYRLNERYWDLRNQAMTHNIERYARFYPRRRLVVLVGFFHRYYLRRELAAGQAAGHYRLIELNGQAIPVP